jgi:hydroxymethylbilane synthase
MSAPAPVRIATRGSDLALAQAERIAGLVRERLGRETELVVVRTSGDRIQNVSLAKIGGKGLFVKEIEEALLSGRADLAVHSAKDLPAAVAPGCVLAAFPERADARDALVARRPGTTLAELPAGARVGTGSVRREAQLRRARGDLEVVPLRGNVPTRLRKLDDEGLDAVVLACAGLDRLGLGDRISERIEPRWLLPAVGQGTLALETRADDPLAQALAALDDPETRTTATAERAFLEGLGGDCATPLAAWARVEGDRVHLEAMLSSRDGSELHRVRHETAREAAAEAGAAAAREVLAHGGRALLDALHAEAGLAT